MIEIESPLKNGIVVCLESALVLSDAKKIWQLPSHLLSAHANRQRDWFSSRLALSRAFAHFGVALDPRSTTFIDSQTIEQHPEFRFSISHTASAAACWLVHDPSKKQRIGFDIEEMTREISTKVAQRIRSTSDGSLTDLEIWCAKEAIFKSLPEAEQTGLIFSKLRLGKDSYEIENSQRKGRYELRRGALVSAFSWS